MLTKLTETEQNIVQQNNGLQRYLESLLVGRPVTPRSWLYETITPDEVQSKWLTILATLRDGSQAEREVYQFDISQLKKWGPQGKILPIQDLMSIATQGFGSSPEPEAFTTPAWMKAKVELTNLLKSKGIQSLRPASYTRVLDDMRARDTLESNSGWPLFQRRNKPEVKESSLQDAESGRWKEYPAIALFRNYYLKTRLVWMFPMATNLVEGSYFQVLQSAMIKAELPFLSPWMGFDRVRSLVSSQYEMGNYLAASDFSQTDTHFNRFASLEVYDVLAPLFQARYRAGLLESLVHMHSIPLVIGPDAKLTGDHGVSSGSNWTNFVETIFDWIFSIYVSSITGVTYHGLYAIGDDMTWVSKKYDAQFSKELERLGTTVGQVIKTEKTTNDPDKVKSLQRLFQRGYSRPDGKIRAVYPTIRALNSSVFPERFHDPRRWSSAMFCARQFMILENCVDHPLFEEFVKFVCSGHRDLVPFAKKSDSELQQILRKTRLLPGLNPTYNQERREYSLASFASIRLAAKM